MVCQRLSHGFPISYIVDRLLDRALSEQVRGRVLESSPSAFILRFPSNKFVNAWPYTHYENYPSEVMIVPSGLRPLSAIIIPL